MSDVLKIKETPCACGSHFLAIEQILGRDDDVLWIQGKRIFPDLLSRKIALATDAFSRYEIIQTGESEIQIHIQSARFEDLDQSTIKMHWHETVFNPTLKQRKIRNEIQHTLH